MGPKPVRSCKQPAYPTRREVLDDPALLQKHIPAFWRASVPLARATTVFLAANFAGCADTEHCNVPAAVEISKPRVELADRKNTPTQPEKIAKGLVAPLFEHGEGRGATGCVVIAPPVFLSEEEALQVIREEFAKSGIVLDRGNTVLKGTRVAPRYRRLVEKESGEWIWKEIFADRAAAKDLAVDALSTKHGVALEFISEWDYEIVGGVGHVAKIVDEKGQPRGGLVSTVHHYNFKDAARWIASEVGQQDQELYFGIFYDPMVSSHPDDFKDVPGEWKDRREMAKKAALQESRDLLRRQAEDFVGWLKERGVI